MAGPRFLYLNPERLLVPFVRPPQLAASFSVVRSQYDGIENGRAGTHIDWMTPFKNNISDVEYQVTEKGRAAAAFEGVRRMRVGDEIQQG
jgi:hypothetical protein